MKSSWEWRVPLRAVSRQDAAFWDNVSAGDIVGLVVVSGTFRRPLFSTWVILANLECSYGVSA